MERAKHVKSKCTRIWWPRYLVLIQKKLRENGISFEMQGIRSNPFVKIMITSTYKMAGLQQSAQCSASWVFRFGRSSTTGCMGVKLVDIWLGFFSSKQKKLCWNRNAPKEALNKSSWFHWLVATCIHFTLFLLPKSLETHSSTASTPET